MDIKIMFLQKNLYKEVYILQSQGFIAKEKKKICKLKKSLYKLQQAFKVWQLKIDLYLIGKGFEKNKRYYNLFTI